MPPTPLLQLTDIHKTYRTGEVAFEALKGVSLEVRKGEFLAIMGPSGSGKSTFMHIMGLLDSYDQGSYLFDRIDVNTLGPREQAYFRNQNIGFVFQSFNLMSRINLLDNVALPLIYAGVGRQERRERSHAALAQVGLEPWKLHRPVEISGGQKQRVAIARALVGHPQVLLADEPTGNLDSVSAEEVMLLFKELNQQGMTVITITHDPKIASYAERTVEFLDGRIERVF